MTPQQRAADIPEPPSTLGSDRFDELSDRPLPEPPAATASADTDLVQDPGVDDQDLEVQLEKMLVEVSAVAAGIEVSAVERQFATPVPAIAEPAAGVTRLEWLGELVEPTLRCARRTLRDFAWAEAQDRSVRTFTVALAFERLSAYGDLLGQFVTMTRAEIEQRTQFQRRKEIIPRAPYWNDLRNAALKINKQLTHRLWVPSSGFDGEPYSPPIREQLDQAVVEIALLDSEFGSFDIWAKKPLGATLKGLVAAHQKQESDFEDYLIWMRLRYLGLLDNQLDPYIAGVILGLRTSAGQLVMPGDLAIRRNGQQISLTELSDGEISAELIKTSRRRKRSNEFGKSDLSQTKIGGVTYYFEEIDELFRYEGELEGELEGDTALGLAFIRAAKRGDWERIGRAAQLDREQARFAGRVAAGSAKPTDDECAWKAILRHKNALGQAMSNEARSGKVSKRIADEVRSLVPTADVRQHNAGTGKYHHEEIDGSDKRIYDPTYFRNFLPLQEDQVSEGMLTARRDRAKRGRDRKIIFRGKC